MIRTNPNSTPYLLRMKRFRMLCSQTCTNKVKWMATRSLATRCTVFAHYTVVFVHQSHAQNNMQTFLVVEYGTGIARCACDYACIYCIEGVFQTTKLCAWLGLAWLIRCCLHSILRIFFNGWRICILFTLLRLSPWNIYIRRRQRQHQKANFQTKTLHCISSSIHFTSVLKETLLRNRERKQ